jgi:hypothetical protein
MWNHVSCQVLGVAGKDFTGARPVEDFRAAIDAALADVAASP